MVLEECFSPLRETMLQQTSHEEDSTEPHYTASAPLGGSSTFLHWFKPLFDAGKSKGAEVFHEVPSEINLIGTPQSFEEAVTNNGDSLSDM
jgi:hypothetical protein